MCGFIGFTGETEHRKEVIRSMADKIIHRGPDMEGYYVSEDMGRDSVTLGFRRLSIIDLADGAQPMYNEDGSVVIVFNGEIYNFMTLREELMAKALACSLPSDEQFLAPTIATEGTSSGGRSLI